MGGDQKSTQWCWTWAIHEKGVQDLGKRESGILLKEAASERILGTRQPQNEGQLISNVWPYFGLQKPRGEVLGNTILRYITFIYVAFV